MLKGKQLAEMNELKKNIASLDEVAFQVFSQYGEDGIIQYIIGQVEIPNKIFIEFTLHKYYLRPFRLFFLASTIQEISRLYLSYQWLIRSYG